MTSLTGYCRDRRNNYYSVTFSIFITCSSNFIHFLADGEDVINLIIYTSHTC
jgi:hypothetical protein